MRRGVSLLAAMLLSGCVGEILDPAPRTVLEFTCTMLQPARAETVVVEAWVDPEANVAWTPAMAGLAEELARATGRDPATFAVAKESIEPPEEGWTAAEIAEWGEAEHFVSRGVVTLRVLWTPHVGGLATGVVPSPGHVAIAYDAVAAGALAANGSVEDALRAVLLHYAGHALAAVNLGVPVQDPEIQDREGPPGHDPDPGSVMSANWHGVTSMAWAPNATYDAYPDDVVADWRAAAGPDGICSEV